MGGAYSGAYSKAYDIEDDLTWVAIRTGVKDRLDTITGVASHSRAALGQADSVIATIIPLRPLITPAAHRGKVNVEFAVRITVIKASLEDSQTALDAYIWPTGTNSIIAALYGDSTLGAVVDDLQFTEVTDYEQIAESSSVRADINFQALVTP